jgi:hypothetical protein
MGKAQRLRTAPPVGNAGYVDPEPAGPSTIYLPNLIVALVASVGIVVGSLGPWVTLLMFDRNATDGDGKYTLVLGIIAAAMLFVVLNLGQSWTKTALMRRLTILAALSGGLSFAIGVIDAHEVLSRKVELFGTTIGAQIGWGLWLTLIASLALVVTAVVVAKQLPSEDES